MSEASEVDTLIQLVELNVGNWKPLAVAIIDINLKIWGEKGKIPQEYLKYYENFPLKGMHVGDSVNNSNSFFMKVTEKTGVIVVMQDPHISRLAAINLRGRLNALSPFYNLEKQIKEKEKKTILDKILKKEEKLW
ncbi:MAG: hypothetical protein QW279_02195 [Candidatus Jordarchaeaceae archaeon]